MSIVDPLTNMRVELVPMGELSYLREAERRHLQADGVHWLQNMKHLLTILEEIKPATYLDFGCSGGHFLSAVPIAQKYGFEPDPYARKKAEEKGLKVFETWEDVCSVSCISVIDVVEHMESREVVSLIYRLRDKLQDSGHVLFQTDNPRSIAAQLDFYNDYTHVRMYDMWTFANLLNLAGFCTIKGMKVIPGIDGSQMETLQNSMIPAYRDPYMKWVILAQKVM